MWRYDVQGFITPIIFCFICSAVGLSALAKLTTSEPGGGWIVLTISGSTFLWFGLHLLWEVHKIGVTRSGQITFKRVMGTTRVNAGDIRRMEGRYVADYDGKRWSLRVHYVPRGRERHVDLPQFDEVSDFTERVRQFNPSFMITGIWPRGAP